MRGLKCVLLTLLLVALVLVGTGCWQAATEPSAYASSDIVTPGSEETVDEADSENSTEKSAPGGGEAESLDNWLGYYSFSGKYLYGLEDANSWIYIDLIIFREVEEYWGCLNMYGINGAIDDLHDNMLVKIQGTQEQIQVIFAESFSDEAGRGDIFQTYRDDELLFSLEKNESHIMHIGGGMKPDMEQAHVEGQFWHENEWVSLSLGNAAGRTNFLRAVGFTEGTAPFYQYYRDDGTLQFELFYDMEKTSGIGIFYSGASMTGFHVGGYVQSVWQDETTSMVRDSIAYRYDADERLVYVRSYITHGSLEYYYIYDDGKGTPSFRLTVDHNIGKQIFDYGFVKYLLPEHKG